MERVCIFMGQRAAQAVEFEARDHAAQVAAGGGQGWVLSCQPVQRLLQAAHGMGASRTYAFRKIFLPLSVPGVISGVLIVFILAMGFFVTPALMGGPRDVMMAMLIQRNIEVTMNWPQACALSIFLLVITLAIYAVYCRFTDLDRMLGK